MAGGKQLGIFWGSKALYFVESIDQQPQKVFQVTFGEAEKGTTIEDGVMIPGTQRLASLIQKAFHKQGISPSSVNLSLPTRDIIFRSFTIPWMQPNEVKGVVDFESSKYIPFALEELSYSYHPVTITVDNTKQIRIIFVAIKKDALENYTNLLENAGLGVDIVEPAPLSLIRALNLKNLIPPDKTIALVEQGDDLGKIIIMDNGVPQFVREFQFKPTEPNGPLEKQALMTQLIKEIRISLDYFNRQNSQVEISQTLLLTPSNTQDLAKSLEDELSIPVTAIDCHSIIGNTLTNATQYINAFGAGLVDSVESTADFFLMEKGSKQGRSKRLLKKKSNINYKPVATVALACIGLMTLTVTLSTQAVTNPKAKIATLSQKLGPMKDASVGKIEAKSAELNTKLENFKNVRFESDMAYFLALLPGLMPQGTWLNDLQIVYQTKTIDQSQRSRRGFALPTLKKETGVQPIMEISGYAYLDDTKEQFQLVNTFITNLKKDKSLKEFFNEINLETVKAQTMNDYTTTFFKIKCQ